MRWLLHGSLTPAAAEALRRHGHDIRLLTEAELAPDAAPSDLLRAAHQYQLDVLTNDPTLTDAIYEDKLHFDRTIVQLNVEPGDVEQDDAIDRLFARYKRLAPGRLYTVTGSRVKIRQLPGRV
jgi:hypothetical protein